MGNVRLYGSTSGYTELAPPAVAPDGVLSLPSGTGTLLTAEGGKVLQVVTSTTSTAVSTTSTSYVTTGLTATITPSKTTSKILVLTSMQTEKTTNNVYSGVETAVFRGTVAGTLLQSGIFFAEGNVPMAQTNFVVLDSPSTVSAQTYTVGLRTNSGLTAVTAVKNGALATITLMEISA